MRRVQSRALAAPHTGLTPGRRQRRAPRNRRRSRSTEAGRPPIPPVFASNRPTSTATAPIRSKNTGFLSTLLTLGKPLLQTEPYFTDVGSVVRTRAGDLWVADPGGRELVRVSGKTGAITVVGREGEGPGEYRAPQMVFAMGVDTVMLFDSRLFRLNVYHADGRYLRSVSMGTVETTTNFVSGDDRGKLIGTSLDLSGAGTGTTRPVVRFTVASGKLDTITRIVGERLVALPGHMNKPGMRRFGFVPYSDADAVVGLTTGGFVIARASTGRVQWHDASGRLIFETMFPGERQPIADSILRRMEPALRAHIPKRRLSSKVGELSARQATACGSAPTLVRGVRRCGTGSRRGSAHHWRWSCQGVRKLWVPANHIYISYGARMMGCDRWK